MKALFLIAIPILLLIAPIHLVDVRAKQKHSDSGGSDSSSSSSTQQSPRCVSAISATGGLLAGPRYTGYQEAGSEVTQYHTNKTHVYSSLQAYNDLRNPDAQSVRNDCGVNDIHGDFAQGYNYYFGVRLNQTKLHGVVGITYNDCLTAAGVVIDPCLPTIRVTFDNGTTTVIREYPGSTNAVSLQRDFTKGVESNE